MEFVLVILLLLLVTSVLSKSFNDKKQQQLPPSPRRSLPVIGHLHLVGYRAPHVTLRDLDARYGHDGLLLVRLGKVRTVVVSSPAAAEAVTRTCDKDLASRPPCTAARALFMEGCTDVAFASYGEQWRQSRMLVIAHMLSTKRVAAQRLGREEEVQIAISGIRDAAAAGRSVNLTDVLYSFTTGVVCRAISRRFFNSPHRTAMLRDLIHETAALLAFNLEDYMPWVGPLASIMRVRAGKIRNRWDHVLESLVAAHLQAQAEADKQHEEDFIGAILADGLTHDNMRALVVDLFIGGIDTSHTVLLFAMLELCRNPRVMRALQSELRRVPPGGGGRTLAEADVAGLRYLRCVIKETLRLHPPAPLWAHYSMKEVQVGSYTIPAGCPIFVNAWAMGRDPRLWDRHDDFLPERFLLGGDGAAAVNITDNSGFRLLPFGAGRRVCPGVSFAQPSMLSMLANLVCQFDWELPPDMDRPEEQEVFRLTLTRKSNLLLLPTTAA